MLSGEVEPIRQNPVRRRGLFFLAAVLIGLFLLLRGAALVWTDYLWFDAEGLGSVWLTLTLTRVAVVASATVIAFALLWISLLIAGRVSPGITLMAADDQEEMIERFSEWVGPRLGRVRLLVAAVFAVLSGLSATVWTYPAIQFFNARSFGITDPIFGQDASFYVFRLPFWRDLQGWFFQLVVLALILAVAVHYLNGGIRLLPNQVPQISSGVKAHLSGLVALLAFLKAGAYRLDMFELVYSDRGRVTGASYTDVVAQRPALNLLVLIALFGGFALLWNIRQRGWTLPAVAAVGWLGVSLIVGGAIPAVVQRLRVVPDEINKEVEYVAYNIEFTRIAYGLDQIEVRDFAAEQTLTGEDIENNRPTIDNLRLWDPIVLESTYKSSHELLPYYGFLDVDVDRYSLGGVVTQVELGARELDRSGAEVAGDRWVNLHLVFTHGYGAVVSEANNVTSEGKPEYLVKDIPPASTVSELEIEQPRIYFGEAFDPDSFVFAGTTTEEVDPDPDFNSYDGEGGVELGGILRRAAFALRFNDFNTLISGQLSPDSRVMMRRNLLGRVNTVAPFLSADNDPYLVVLDGRLVWVVDMYTTSNAFPYAQGADTGRLPELTQGGLYLPNRFNYVRNSVKTVVDAYDGTMTFYVVDPTDPVITSWRAAFPDLFTDASAMPAELLDHLRYPEDLFRVQSDMYRLYHVTDARVFFENSDPWAIASDPSTTDEGRTRLDQRLGPLEVRPMMPYYLLMRLPDEEDTEFLIMQPYTPADKENMISFMIGKSDSGSYGELIDFRLPPDRQFDGPALVGQDINQDSDYSSLRTLLGQEGSEIIQGQMLVVPIEESILFVQPIYLQGDGENTIPEFKRAVVVFRDRIIIGESLEGALAQIFDGFVPRSDVVIPDDPSGLPDDVAALLERAEVAFADAQAALSAGDLGTYQAKVDEAQRLVTQAISRLREVESG
ncbi:MAG: UPF0182 family protein [Acidimicrobiia bacterium]|nr:UPF0182 family protein [Acidimicrobiia bacterium]